MLSSTWTPRAVSSEARAWAARAWRMVEAQHAAATMKLVDTAGEQALGPAPKCELAGLLLDLIKERLA